MRRARRVAGLAVTAIGAASVLGAGALAPADEGVDISELFTGEQLREIARLSPLGPPPADPSNRVYENPIAAELGQRFFYEPGFSYMGGVSCATCHAPGMGFADRKQISIGESLGDRHSPSLWNVAYSRWMFWDGRADSIWAQALGPFETLHEMGSTRTRAVRVVASKPVLRLQYELLFGDLPDMRDTSRFPIDASPVEMDDGGVAGRGWESMSTDDQAAINSAFVNIGKSIAAYERLLVTDDSRFDRFVKGLRTGDAELINEMSVRELRGLKLFVGEAGCLRCHSGPNFSDGAFHDNRVAPLEGGEPKDAGRFGGIDKLRESPFTRDGLHSDAPAEHPGHANLVNGSHNWGAFKVPTLRNIELTPPYMHQGQLGTLRDVLEHYNTLENATPLGHHSQEQILEPLGLSDGQLDDLEAFLRSLTDTSIDSSLFGPPR